MSALGKLVILTLCQQLPVFPGNGHRQGRSEYLKGASGALKRSDNV
jgi:hypothetical protein